MADTTKTTVTNISDGPRGFWEGSECIMLDKKQVAVAELTDDEAKAAKATGYFSLAAPKTDASGPPSLNNKTKAELLDIAKDEGVDVEEGATVTDIKAAIELNREAGEG